LIPPKGAKASGRCRDDLPQRASESGVIAAG
jgi:hypothetical protein